MHDARLGGEFGQRQGGGRYAEVDDAVDPGQQRQRIIGDRHIERPDAGEDAHVGAEMR